MSRTLGSPGARLAYARNKRGLTQTQLADLADLSQSSVSKIEKGASQESAKLTALARALGVSIDWLELDQGNEPDWDLPQAQGLAHEMTHRRFDDGLLTMEQIMNMERLPERFVYVLHDDAMGKHGRAGTEVLFARAQAAKPGAGVLVRDQAGVLHVRRKAQGRNDSHWLAVAPNPSYRDLDSDADGLELLAVWRGVVNRGLEDE